MSLDEIVDGAPKYDDIFKIEVLKERELQDERILHQRLENSKRLLDDLRNQKRADFENIEEVEKREEEIRTYRKNRKRFWWLERLRKRKVSIVNKITYGMKRRVILEMFDKETMQILLPKAKRHHKRVANIVGCKPSAVYRICKEYMDNGFKIRMSLGG